MRIVLVTPMPPDPTGPGAIPRLLSAQLEGLGARHEVTVVTVAGPEGWQLDAVRRLAADGVDVRAALREEPRDAGARMRRRRRLAACWGVRRLPWRTGWFWDPSLQDALDRRLAEGPVDVVQAEDNATGVYRLPGATPAILTEYEVRRPRPFRLGGRDGAGPLRALAGEIDWRRWRGYQPRVWRRFDRILVFTGRDAESVGQLAPDVLSRVRVTPFGVRLPPPADPARERPGAMVFVGNFSHPPNVDAAVWLGREIVPMVRRVVPGARLAIVGEQAPPAVTALAGPGVEVVGAVDDPGPWLEGAEVVLAPVRTGGGMRMKVLEALAAGKPIVTTPRGALGFAADAPLSIAEDAAGIASATATLLGDAGMRRAMGAAGRAFAEAHHSPDAYARRLEAVYEELVDRGARAAGARAGR